MPNWSIVLLLLVVSYFGGYGQVKKKIREYERTFQLSLFPGISSNGIASGFYINRYSINLISGLSAGNRILELALIANNNIKSVTGIQLSGLANIVGTNAFINLSLWEERELIHDGYESNSDGIQLAGFLNYVRNHSRGIHLAGAFNIVGFNMRGLHAAGVGNTAGGFADGLQLAGLYNVANKSVTGFQISTLYNFTNGRLAGIQFGLLNRARFVNGKKSTPPTPARGLQIGLVNVAKEMDGVQVGLINFGGASRGKQIGLINFFDRMGSKENVRMGTPVGLINKGSKGSYFRLYHNELHAVNAEYTTGNCLNCTYVMGSEMPYHDRNKIYSQNALIFGYDHAKQNWSFGYGFQKVLFNKASVMPNPDNEKRMITYGIRLLHLNRDMTLDRAFNLLTRLNMDYGRRVKSLYWFAGISLNYFIVDALVEKNAYPLPAVHVAGGAWHNRVAYCWPGYSVGIHF